jgi:hypothetical protein
MTADSDGPRRIHTDHGGQKGGTDDTITTPRRARRGANHRSPPIGTDHGGQQGDGRRQATVEYWGPATRPAGRHGSRRIHTDHGGPKGGTDDTITTPRRARRGANHRSPPIGTDHRGQQGDGRRQATATATATPRFLGARDQSAPRNDKGDVLRAGAAGAGVGTWREAHAGRRTNPHAPTRRTTIAALRATAKGAREGRGPGVSARRLLRRCGLRRRSGRRGGRRSGR